MRPLMNAPRTYKDNRTMTLRLGPKLFVLAALALMLYAAGGRADAPAGRFAKSTGIVTDTKTGLTWQQPASSATYTSDAAYTYCAGLGTGWRVPTAKELLTLVGLTPPSFPGPRSTNGGGRPTGCR